MKILGVIAEYDPFHLGHAFHLKTAKEQSDSDGVLILMSGHGVQRGGFPVEDKWSRASRAIHAGADLVCELPYCFSGQTAEIFAGGAIALLDAAGCQYFSFGTETDNLAQLRTLAELLANESQTYQDTLNQALSKGLSFPAARQEAAEKELGFEIASILKKPNAMLSVEYLKACIRIQSEMMPLPILRKGAHHGQINADGELLSASAIRQNLLKGTTDGLSSALPYPIHQLNGTLYKERNNKAEAIILARLLTTTPDELSVFPDVREGLEFALLNSIKAHWNLEAIINAVASKRIPKSRIRRILMNVLVGFTQKNFADLSASKRPHYLRVLACNDMGKKMIRHIQNNCDLPIITNLHANQVQLGPISKKALAFDCRLTDLFYLCSGEPELIHADYRNHPVMITK